MSRRWLAWVLLFPAAACAQQGLLPLGSTVDAPYTALMHRRDVAAHSAIRPYLREDLKALPGADSLLPAAWRPWLQRMGDPSRRWYGGPLVDAQAGASLAGDEGLKYRVGAGGWLEWSAHPRWSLGASAQAWTEQLPNYLDRFAHVQEVVPGEGYAQRLDDAVAHMDWTAYADYKAGEYFHFTLGKGRNSLGEGYRSLFLSDEAYSYPYFKVTTTAWHFRYVNLFTLMRDIRGAGGDPVRFATKFTSMHYLSWNISRRVNAGFFEAIVWQDNDPDYPRGLDLSYVNPAIFYRPVEFGLGSPDNALMGAALNVKAGRRMLFYGQVILDEFLLSHVRAGDGWYGNKQGAQLGVVAHGPFRVNGLTLRGEVNYVRPFMYAHTDSRQNYAHFGQPLAHPYGSGFMEALVQGEWRKGPWLVSQLFSAAIMGQDTTFGPGRNHGNNIFLSDSDRPTLPGGTRPQDLGYRIGDPDRTLVLHNELRAGRFLDARSGWMLELAWTLRSETSEWGPDRLTNYVRVGLAAHLNGPHPLQTVR
ncbi:MAG: hypothetical protein KDB93_11535 [Flavobacteriales bacterium]|nr:hypothetical protein [Flavobacteriales bacterium]